MSHTHTIFLDHASTTPVHPEVLGLMLPFFGNHFATPSNPFGFGDTPRKALEEARSRVGRLIGSQGHEIVFTSSGTEANNLAVLGTARAHGGKKRHIVTSSIEHASVLHAVHHLRDTGFEVTELGVNAQGLVDPAAVRSAIRDDTFLVTIMHASNETGAVEPIEEIGLIAREHGVIFHCDCVQSAGKVSIDVNAIHADLLSISSHKLYGPKGVGALYVRDSTVISPILFGSGQERGLRPGTVNVPCIVGFGLACEKARDTLKENARSVALLRDRLEQGLMDRIPGIRINGHDAPRLPHISSISFEGIQADSLAAWLDLLDIAVSPRASLFSKRTSQTLSALHIPPELAFGTVRFSPGRENTAPEIDKTVEAVRRAVTGLRDFAHLVEGQEACVLTFSDRKDVAAAFRVLQGGDIPSIVMPLPVELKHLAGPRITLAVPCMRQDEAGSLLGSQGISITGMHPVKGLCRERSDQEKRFWDKVSAVKKDRKEPS